MMKILSTLVKKFGDGNSKFGDGTGFKKGDGNGFRLGFTMIELLIVIAILGILAVAVLSAINPVEQINRGRDTGSRSDAEQLLSALDRYNAFAGYYPWQEGGSDISYEVTWKPWTDEGDFLQNTTGCMVSDLLGAGVAPCTGANELKITFFNRIFDDSYNTLRVYHEDLSTASTYVCFVPRSDAFKTEAANRVLAGVPGDYPAEAVGNTDPTTGCGTEGNCICLP